MDLLYVRGSGDNVTTYTANRAVFYKTISFVATNTAATTFEITAANLTGTNIYDTYLTLYQTAFNPASPATNFLRGDGDSGTLQYSSKLTHNLVAGTTYILVVSTHANGVTGTFTLQANTAVFGQTVNWYLNASGGSPLATGVVFSPVGVAGSGIPNTATAGSTTFYVADTLYPDCRTATTFSIINSGLSSPNSATVCSNTPFTYTGTTAAVGTFTFAWTRAAVSGISNPAGSASSASISETLINTTSSPITVQYLFTISPDACGGTPTPQPVNVVVNPSTITPTVATYAVCQNGSVPSGEGLAVAASPLITTLNGTIASGPTYVRGSGNNVTTYTADRAVFYKTYTFVATASGALTLATTAAVLTPGSPKDTYLTLYQTSFNPASPATNFLIGNDDISNTNFLSSLTQTVTAGTTYIVVVSTFTTGATGTFTLQASTAVFGQTVGQTVTWYLNASGGSPLATGAVFNPVGVAGSGIPNTATAGSTTFYVADAIYPDCRTATTFSIIGSPIPSVTNNLSVCFNASTLLTATCSGGTPTWYNANSVAIPFTGTTYNTPNLTENTTYKVRCETANCSSAFTDILVTVSPTATASSNSPICAGTTLNLTGGGGTGYAWAGPNTYSSTNQSPSISGATTAASGIYTLTVTTSGCTSTATTSVTVNPNPTASASSNSPICAGTTLNLTGGGVGTYSWTSSNGFTSTDQSPTISNATVSASGTYTITVTNVSGCTSTASVAVTVNALPTATATSNTPICAGNTLNLTGGGVGTYSWTSSNGYTSIDQSPTISNATVSASGTYTITVTNANGCISTASVVVTVNALPTATANSNSPICAGNTLNLTGGGVGTYSWTSSNGFTSNVQSPSIPNATVSNSGTYTITVTNANGCTSTASVAVTVNALPTATATSNSPICAGNTLNLTGGGVGTYSWTSSNGFTSTAQSPTIANATVSASGTYTITVTNVSGCTSTASVAVTVNALPTATANSNSPICEGTTLNLTGGGIGTYSWTSSNGFTSTDQSPTISNATVSASGTYTITISNANGCTSTASVAVTVNALPTATASSNSPICAGNTLNLTGGGVGTYSWTSSNGYTSTDQSPTISNATVSASGTYTVTVTNANGCTSTASVTVTVNALPTATANSNSPICAGNTLNLTGGGVGNSYAWTSSNGYTSNVQSPSIPNVTVSASGTYTITVTNANGCTSTASVAVTVNALPTATANSNSPICAGNTLNLTGGGVGNSYAWTSSNGYTSNVQSPSIPNVTVSASGTYTITVTNANGCTSTASVTVTVNALPTATASNNSPICSGVTLNLTGGGVGTYLWNGPGSYTSTDQSPSIPSATASMSGTYTITITNVSGCTSAATTSVTINPVVAIPTPQANTQIIFGASITLTATGCSGVNDVLKWYQSADNALATMPVSPTATTNYYAKCETTLNGITCISGNSSDVTVTVLQPNPPVATGATNCLGTPTTLTATGCSGSVGTFVLKWYQNADDALVTMPVSPSTTTDYYAKCEQTFNAVTAISAKSNVVTLTILNPPTPVSTGGTIYNGQSISLTATGCTGTLGTFTLKWYQTSDNVLVTMPVSPTVTTQYYAKCEQTANSVTCLSAKSNDVTVTVVNRIFVDITKIAAPIQNGNSWATAYGNLQTGLAAATAGVEVWVAKGTYKPTTTLSRTIYFEIPNNVKVYGGFAGTEDNLIDRNFRTNVTILSGDIGTPNLETDNSYHVVMMNGSSSITVLDGFTVTGGYANFDPKRTYNASPAAPTTATIETGGGILVQNAGSPTIANCYVIQNAAVTGGGLYAGDASTPTILFCKFMGNQAGFGSGMYFQDGSNGVINNTLISGNRGIGGVYSNNSNPMITNVTFSGNGGYNGGIFNSNSQPVIKNSVIWGNSTPFNDTQSIITYSTVQGGYAGVGNLSMDPKFVSQMPEGLSPNISGDYHLQALSLAIDRGDNGSIALTDKDLDGNLRRFAGGRVDMGTYEFQGVATATLVISVQTGNWESNSTWDVGRVPQLGDYVIIDSNHIVTLNGTGIAKNLEYRGTGQLKFNTATSKIEIGF